MNRVLAISLLVSPCVTRRATSSSRLLRRCFGLTSCTRLAGLIIRRCRPIAVRGSPGRRARANCATHVPGRDLTGDRAFGELLDKQCPNGEWACHKPWPPCETALSVVQFYL